MAKLQEFISSVKATGLMRTARYTLLVPDGNIGQLLGMYCDQVTLPGLNYNTVANTIFGESREVPYGRLFDPITLSFYVDNDMKIKKYFDSWQQSIQNPQTRTFNYYSSYIKDIQLNVEDLENKERYSIMMHECYPKTINAIQLDYASKEVMKLSVTLQYKYWEPMQIAGNDNVNFLNTDLLSESQSIFTGVTRDIIGLAQNYGATALQNALISL